MVDPAPKAIHRSFEVVGEKAPSMNRFIVAVFPDAPSAQQGLLALKTLAAETVIQLHGAATATKEDNGKLSMHVAADDGPAVMATGAVIGGLAGLALGPLAAAVLATGGAVFGASAGLTNRGAGMAYAKRVSEKLAPGLVAVVADVTTEDPDTLEARLKSVGATLNLHDE